MNEEPEAEPIGSPALGNVDAGVTRPPHQPGYSVKDFLFPARDDYGRRAHRALD